MAPTRDQLERQYRALQFARVDMRMAAETAAYLLGEHEEMTPAHDAGMPWMARRTLEAGLIVTYCRPFTESRLAQLSLPSGIPDEYRMVHQGLMNLRDQVYAHTDDTPLRHLKAEPLADTPGALGLVEGWYPPDRDELAVLIRLAGLISAALEAKAGKVLERLAATALEVPGPT